MSNVKQLHDKLQTMYETDPESVHPDITILMDLAARLEKLEAFLSEEDLKIDPNNLKDILEQLKQCEAALIDCAILPKE